MVHDEFCELGKQYIASCRCAQRAYEKDPLPDAPPPWRIDDPTIEERLSR